MRVQVLTALMALSLSAPAFADSSLPQSSPVGIGKPHSCGQEYYPRSAVVSFTSGTTIVQFMIDTNGVPQNVKVDRSSGNADLDEAAVECTSHWRYSPARQDGKPVPVLWKAQVVWKMPTVYQPVGFNPDAHRCAAMFEHKLASSSEGIDIVFWIDESGHATDPKIVKSSGDQDLDADLAKCVSGWTYVPPSQDGKPVGITWGVSFRWTSEKSIGIGEGFPNPHYCITPFAHDAPAGKTVLRFQISSLGGVGSVDVAESSGDSDFDTAAKACARTWRYRRLDADRAVPIDWSVQVFWSYWLGTVGELGRGDAVPDGQD